VVADLVSVLQDGMTSLMKASKNGETDVAKLLLESKAVIDHKDNVIASVAGVWV
jgi:ankyrin repeat protein